MKPLLTRLLSGHWHALHSVNSHLHIWKKCDSRIVGQAVAKPTVLLEREASSHRAYRFIKTHTHADTHAEWMTSFRTRPEAQKLPVIRPISGRQHKRHRSTAGVRARNFAAPCRSLSMQMSCHIRRQNHFCPSPHLSRFASILTQLFKRRHFSISQIAHSFSIFEKTFSLISFGDAIHSIEKRRTQGWWNTLEWTLTAQRQDIDINFMGRLSAPDKRRRTIRLILTGHSTDPSAGVAIYRPLSARRLSKTPAGMTGFGSLRHDSLTRPKLQTFGRHFDGILGEFGATAASRWIFDKWRYMVRGGR